jgi:hypothetical protein
MVFYPYSCRIYYHRNLSFCNSIISIY